MPVAVTKPARHHRAATVDAFASVTDLRVNPIPFLATQASCLRRGLACADDAAIVSVVAGIHARSHDRWLAMIAVAGETQGPEAADALAALYAFHGRLVDSLQTRTMALLPSAVAARARAVMAMQLDELTTVAMDAQGGEAAAA